MLQRNIGFSALKELDNVTANGNGTTQPAGLMGTAGTITTSAVNQGTGPYFVDDAENLVFGLQKQYRDPAFTPMFVMNDISYQRFRTIAISGADQRRVFGMDEQDYQILGWKVGIQQQIPNNQIAFAAMKKYRMYRRRGFDMRTVTEGETLALKNCILVVGRGRFGGKVVDTNGVNLMLNGQT
jgi:HK97 family phage major capsid protein